MSPKERHMMLVKPLTTRDVTRVVDLERDLFPEKQREGFFRIKTMILNNLRYQSGLALGLFDGSELVGYMLGYPFGFNRNNQSKHEKSVYISDFAVIPGYRQFSADVLVRVMANIKAFFPSRPVVARTSEYYKNKWIKRAPFMKEHGFCLVRSDRYRHVNFDEDLFRLRFEPAGVAVHSIKDRYPSCFLAHLDYYLFKSYVWIHSLYFQRVANV
jgi:hypothetical protein